MEPARNIIRICGGVAEVAEMISRDPSRVHRWMYPKDKGGTGGRIPADLQETLLTKARERGRDLRPEHFFPTVECIGLTNIDYATEDDAL